MDRVYSHARAVEGVQPATVEDEWAGIPRSCRRRGDEVLARKLGYVAFAKQEMGVGLIRVVGTMALPSVYPMLTVKVRGGGGRRGDVPAVGQHLEGLGDHFGACCRACRCT